MPTKRIDRRSQEGEGRPCSNPTSSQMMPKPNMTAAPVAIPINVVRSIGFDLYLLKELASNRLLQSGSQFIVRNRTRMIHRNLPGAIQDDQRGSRTGSVGIEILFAQRHGHVLQAGVITLANRFDISPFLRRRSVGPLRRVAVKLCRADDEQARGSELLPQAGNDGDLGFAVHTPMCPEEQENRGTFQGRENRWLRSEILLCLQGRGGLTDQSEQVEVLLQPRPNGRISIARQSRTQQADRFCVLPFFRHPLREDFVSGTQGGRQVWFGIEFALVCRELSFAVLSNIAGVSCSLIPLPGRSVSARHPRRGFEILRRDAMLSLVASKFRLGGGKRVLRQL